MTVLTFPSVELADETGALCVGGDLEIETLRLAYCSGIFPWPYSEDYPLVWFAPPRRALLFLRDLRITRSLKKELKKNWKITFNTCFPKVIRACAQQRTGRRSQGTWITDDIIHAYSQLNFAGNCHSVEVWQDGNLAGGLYGVSFGGMFAGESMFHNVPNASKVALFYLCKHLSPQGVEWIDCQQLSPHLESLGAREVERDEFMKLLGEALIKPSVLFDR